ncbi:N-acetylmuramoyl-L-alanine amidase [Pseudaminobacter soli (ex Li et al. 2025)]|uniref:N-acetylmuramoyl-L-alanine amidase n=1 Tax=Pseudaminobacter soli (ex Li et al. 2025) TaxID=1295366 RepID=A0A2P7SNT9_9HYPH|nr:N-acetylmuramoyl-L-alanine amidase [Mesorhizobium soli]PSJ64081.1 N-acetylmuramoyl-L-alanine amidase [Mesorhizobium soli]
MRLAEVGRRVLSRFPLLVLLIAGLATFGFAVASAAPLEMTSYKMAGDAVRMRVVMNFDREPEAKWLLLRGPHRLVIDLHDAKFSIDLKDLKAQGLIKSVRYGQIGEGISRLILTTKGPFTVEKFDILKNEDAPGYRVVADITAGSERQFEEALAVQAQTTGSTVTPKTDRLEEKQAQKRFTVVIDPGHGGIDGGAEGQNGTVEKSITLAFALELRAKLATAGNYDVYMTRDKDEFLRLDDRVRIARQHEADLFISIHADTIRLKGIRGATVYTVSEKASDADAQALADRENLSDKLGGIEIEDENHEVADILVDLIRRETHGFSMKFAQSVVGELSNTVGLINNPHRFAGFRVLKAPDVPSVLIELGYLSNPEDEEQLRDPDWRGKAADSISKAVAAFAAAKMAVGG